MSNFIDRLGDEIERAISRGRVRRTMPIGATVAIVAFVSVLLMGIPWLVVNRPSAQVTSSEATASTGIVTSTTSDPRATTQLPATWGRVRHTSAFEGPDSLRLTAIDFGSTGFFTVGFASDGGTLAAVALSSIDGTVWTREDFNIEVAGLAFSDTASRQSERVIVGMTDAGRPQFWYDQGTNEWVVANVRSTVDYAQTSVSQVAVGTTGFTAVGTAVADNGTKSAAIWRSNEGDTWILDESPSFLGQEVAANAVVAPGDQVIVGGLWSGTPGDTTAIIWRTSSLDGWERTTLPPSVRGSSGVLGLAWREQSIVAVGYESVAGAIWWSLDGNTWSMSEGDFSTDGTTTRVHDVASTSEGYVAVGTESVGFDIRKVLWISADGLSWDRLDLEEPLVLNGSTVASGVASNGRVIVVVGTEAEVGGKGVGAIWVSPPGEGTERSVTATPRGVTAHATVSIYPARAVAESVVDVEVISEGEDSILVLIDDVVACVAEGRAVVSRCSFLPGDLNLSVGLHQISVPGMFEPVALEVLPAGSIVMTVNAIYDPKNWPMIFAVFINNNGADAVDLSGWIVRESDGDSFQFPDGTILEPGSTATISQTDPTDKPCPGDIGSVFYMCNAFGSDTVSQETQVWHGGTLTLIDADGLNVASWDS